MTSLMRNMAESKGRNVNIDMGGEKGGATRWQPLREPREFRE